MLSRLTWLFWSKVKILGPDDCWEWQACLNREGYGDFGAARKHGLSRLSSRMAWHLTNGPIPEGILVLHKCDNRACCNPTHLFLGTQLTNCEDRNSKGRQAQGESHGRCKLTQEQVMKIRLDSRPTFELMSEFKVSRSRINKIRRNETWRHV